MKRWLHIFILILMLPGRVLAMAVDSETLPDPAMEARAREIMHGLRCLVCQNQSIESSDAPLAGDLRRIVRERVAAGETDDQVRAHLVARFGDWVLMRPPLRLSTLALWGGPPLLLLTGGLMLWVNLRRRQQMAPEAPADLTPQERARIDQLTGRE